MMPEISVIVPVYNTAEFLEQCLDTIINQTFKNIEIICVDDGSTDSSLKILQKYAERDARVFVIHRDKASGSAALPRNIGIEHAKGKYLMFLDSDDYFDLMMLQKMYTCAEEQEAELVMCDNYVVSAETGLVDDEREGELHYFYIRKENKFSYQDIPDCIFQISNTSVWHKLILRDVVVRNQLRFQENVPILDDIYFACLILVLANSIYILDEKLLYYREGRTDSQTANVRKHKESIYWSVYKVNDYLQKNDLYETVKVSLQNWTIGCMRWWYQMIRDNKNEKELYYLYKESYFPKLNLSNMDENDMYSKNIRFFFRYIMRKDFIPSCREILNSILQEPLKIVLYGAGCQGEKLYHDIHTKQVYQVELWCDRNAGQMNNPLVQLPEKIKACRYDAVIIAIENPDIVCEVKETLRNLGVEDNKIFALLY